MTATAVIRQIKALPSREQAKVRRYIYEHAMPNEPTRKMVEEADVGYELVRSVNADEMFAKLKI